MTVKDEARFTRSTMTTTATSTVKIPAIPFAASIADEAPTAARTVDTATIIVSKISEAANTTATATTVATESAITAAAAVKAAVTAPIDTWGTRNRESILQEDGKTCSTPGTSAVASSRSPSSTRPSSSVSGPEAASSSSSDGDSTLHATTLSKCTIKIVYNTAGSPILHRWCSKHGTFLPCKGSAVANEEARDSAAKRMQTIISQTGQTLPRQMISDRERPFLHRDPDFYFFTKMRHDFRSVTISWSSPEAASVNNSMKIAEETNTAGENQLVAQAATNRTENWDPCATTTAVACSSSSVISTPVSKLECQMASPATSPGNPKFSVALSSINLHNSGSPKPSCMISVSTMKSKAQNASHSPLDHPMTVDVCSSGSSNDNEQLYRNAVGAFKLIPMVMSIVVVSGCTSKYSTETYLEYLYRYKKVSPTSLKNKFDISKDGIEKLKINKSCEGFDACLLYGLIKAGCEKVATHNDSAWEQEDETRIEWLLRKSKNLRNAFCHGDKSATFSAEWFLQMTSTLEKLINVNGNVYSKDSSEIAIDREKLISAVGNLDHKQRIIECTGRFCKNAFLEAKSYWKKYWTYQEIPFSGGSFEREKVFHPIDISLQALSTANNVDDYAPMTSYRNILNDPSHDNRIHFIILTGEAGSGKTTLSRMIALQFFGIIRKEIPSLDEFDLLHYLECRFQKVERMTEFVAENFPTSYRESRIEDGFDCFHYFRNLIVVDGYDECNSYSLSLITEIIKKIKYMPLCKVVLTTRPHLSKNLEELLLSEDVAFCRYKLLEIVEEEDQVEFMRKYWTTVTSTTKPSSVQSNVLHCCPTTENNDPTGHMDTSFRIVNSNPSTLSLSDLILTFKTLNKEVKDFFVCPINLVLFHYLYLNSEDTVKNWNTPNDVTRHILQMYESIIQEKMKNVSPPLVEKTMSVVNEFAFECLANDKLFVTKDDVSDLQKRCREIDIMVIMSVVLIVRSSPTPSNQLTFQFFHKSIQELMASRCLVDTLINEKDSSLKEIIFDLGGISLDTKADSKAAEKDERWIFSKLLNVLRFALMELSSGTTRQKRKVFERRLLEIVNALGFSVSNETDFSSLRCGSRGNGPQIKSNLGCADVYGGGFWIDLVASCPDSDEVAEIVTELCTFSKGLGGIHGLNYCMSSFWRVTSSRLMKAVTRMLKFGHPEWINVSLRRSVEVDPDTIKSFLSAISGHFSGKLILEFEHNYRNYIPLDDSLVKLQSARCKLVKFVGCLGSSEEAARSVAAAASRCGKISFRISLAAPHEHQLRHLGLVTKNLQLSIRLDDLEARRIRGLPFYCLRHLLVTLMCDAPATVQKIATAIRDLTPPNNEDAFLFLEHWSKPDDFILEKLMESIQTSNIWEFGAAFQD